MIAKRLDQVGLTEVVGSPYEHLTTDDLATDVARIGSTPACLVIDRDIDLAAAVVVPATLKLVKMPGVRFVNNGGSIEFEGNPFVFGQEMTREPWFEGFAAGDITFTGDAPSDVSSELAYVAANSITERLALLTEWFDGCKLTFHCFERPITSHVATNDHHNLYFRKGDFTNSYANGTNVAAFIIGSYAKFHSEHGARIFSSSVNQSPQIVRTKDNCMFSMIKDNQFENGGGAFDGISFGVAIASGSFMCHIKNNQANGIQSYQFGIYGAGGNNPSYCTIDRNYSSGISTQNIAVIAGDHCAVTRNTVNVKDFVTGNAYASYIDIEPNQPLDTVRHLLIEGNKIDMRGAALANPEAGEQYAIGIIVQGVVTEGITDLIVRDNEFWCDEEADAQMQTAIEITGVENATVCGNKSRGVGNMFVAKQCNNVKFYNNEENGEYYGAVYMDATGNSRVYNNYTRGAGAVIESEKRHLAASDGSNVITLLHSNADSSDGRMFQSYVGQQMRFNNVLYTVTAVDTVSTFQSVTVNTTVPACDMVSCAASAVDASGNSFNVPAHGFATGAGIVIYTPDGTVPSGLDNLGRYWVIKIDDDHFRLASTRALALANTPIDLTTQGTGTQEFYPALWTEFSNNEYRDNDFSAYTLLGTSRKDAVSKVDDFSTARTLSPADNGETIVFHSNSAVAVTAPAGLGADFGALLIQKGTGQITVSAGAGVTLQNRQSHSKSAGQFAGVSLVAVAADSLVLMGDTAA
ncbi:MAG TPA: hypothetical protein VIL74_09120 [Pyrinomonadaceae bacterium]|jgi:hypothetical protein